MNRQKDVFSQPQHPTLSEMVEEVEITAIPSSSLPVIPQSIARPPGEEPLRNQLLSAVQATPTRRSMPLSQPSNSLLDVPAVDYGVYLPSSPLQARRSAGQLFAIPNSIVNTGTGPALSRGIEETPIKKKANSTPVHGHPVTPSHNSDKENSRGEKNVTKVGTERTLGLSQEESIYKSLGWDDADDLDELS